MYSYNYYTLFAENSVQVYHPEPQILKAGNVLLTHRRTISSNPQSSLESTARPSLWPPRSPAHQSYSLSNPRTSPNIQTPLLSLLSLRPDSSHPRRSHRPVPRPRTSLLRTASPGRPECAHYAARNMGGAGSRPVETPVRST